MNTVYWTLVFIRAGAKGGGQASHFGSLTPLLLLTICITNIQLNHYFFNQ